MKRLVFSIIAGVAAGAALSVGTDFALHFMGVYPPVGEPLFDTGLLLLASAYRVVFQIIGGYVTASLARDQAKKAVWIVGILGAAFWLAGTIAMYEKSTAWYGILGTVLAIPTALLGERLNEVRIVRTKKTI